MRFTETYTSGTHTSIKFVVQRVETEFKFRHGCLQRGAVGVVQGQTYQNFFVHKDTLTSCVFFYKNTLPRPAPQEAKWPLS